MFGSCKEWMSSFCICRNVNIKAVYLPWKVFPLPPPHPQNEKQYYMHNLVFNNPTKLELDQLKTYWKIQLTLSLVSILSVTSVTLKYGQVNQQCHKWTKLTKLYHQAKFDIYHTYSLQQNWNVDVFAMKNWSVRQPRWQTGTDHYTCRLNSFYMYASQMYLTWLPHCWQCSKFHFESVDWWHLHCTAKAPVNCSPDTATPPCCQYIILKVTYTHELIIKVVWVHSYISYT